MDGAHGWRVGMRVDDYLLEAELGAGGMGTVYQARHVRTGGEVAVKAITWPDPEMIARLQREGELQARAEGHPNLARIHGTGAAGGVPYLVVELLRGGSLERRIQRADLAPEEAARIVRDLALGVAHAHRAGVLHRDIKPANVLFDELDRPKLLDFGLARPVETGPGSLTRSGAIMGSPQHMSPEQARCEASAIGPRTDVYGLGAVLYHCLTGQPPHPGQTLFAAVQQALEEDPVPARRLRASVPRALEAICARALARDPAGRPSSAEALAGELDAWLDSPPEEGRRLLPVGLALGALVIALGLAVMLSVSGEAAAIPAPGPALVAPPRLDSPRLVPPSKPAPASPAAAHLERAARALAGKGEAGLLEALDEYRKAAELDPDAAWPPELPGLVREKLRGGLGFGGMDSDDWLKLAIGAQRLGLTHGILPPLSTGAFEGGVRVSVQRYLEDHPGDWGAWLFLARWCAEREDKDPEALRRARELAQRVAEDPRASRAAIATARGTIGIALMKLRELPEAVVEMVAAVDLGHGCPDDVLRTAATLAFIGGDQERAIELAERAVIACDERAAGCREGPQGLARGRPPGRPFDVFDSDQSAEGERAQARVLRFRVLMRAERDVPTLIGVLREAHGIDVEGTRKGLADGVLLLLSLKPERAGLVLALQAEPCGRLMLELTGASWREKAKAESDLEERARCLDNAAFFEETAREGDPERQAPR